MAPTTRPEGATIFNKLNYLKGLNWTEYKKAIQPLIVALLLAVGTAIQTGNIGWTQVGVIVAGFITHLRVFFVENYYVAEGDEMVTDDMVTIVPAAS